MNDGTSGNTRSIKVQSVASELVATLQLTGKESLETLCALVRKDAIGLAQAPVKIILDDGSIVQGPRELNRLVDGDTLTIVCLGVAENACVIVDLGSTICRVGVVGEELVRGQFECSAVVPNHSCAEHVQNMRPEMLINMDLHELHAIWQHAFFNELRIDPKHHPVLLTVQLLTSRSCLEGATQMMFEEFNVPTLMLLSRIKMEFFQAHFSTGPFRDPASFALAMSSDDYTSWNVGSVVHIGNKYTLAVPIYEGFELPHAIQMFCRGYQSFTQCFANAMEMPSNSAADLSAVHHAMMRESTGHDVEQQQKIHNITSSCIESFTKNFLDGGSRKTSSEAKSIGHFFREMVRLCDEDIRVDVCRNIVLGGSLARLPGLSEGIERETEEALKAPDTNALWNGALKDGHRIRLGPCHTVPQFKRVRQLFIAPPQAGFHGARIFHSQLREYNEISLTEYEEKGPTVGHHKFF